MEGEFDLIIQIVSGFSLEAVGEVLGLLEHELVVVEGKGLERCRGGEAFGSEVGRIGAIEGGHESIRSGANNVAVDAASPEFGFVSGDVSVLGGVGFLVFEIFEAGSAALFVEFSADRENGIPDRFGFDAAGVLPPEEAVGGVNVVAGIGVWEMRDLLVGLAEKDLAVKGFERPVLTNEFGGEPVE